MNQSLVVITPPTAEPVSLAEARQWLRIEADDTANTTMLALLIEAMREYAEELTGRAFVQRTLELRMDSLPTEIELPYPKLMSVEFVKYTDDDEALQTLAADQYQVDTSREPGLIVPAWSAATWPTAIPIPNSVRIRFVAGDYDGGSPTVPVPAKLRLWMMQRIGTLFEHREALIVGATVQPLPRDHVDGLLDSLVLAQRILG
jgi:uncharacterized phiE125 gp8 family phage protein